MSYYIILCYIIYHTISYDIVVYYLMLVPCSAGFCTGRDRQFSKPQPGKTQSYMSKGI